MTLYEGVRTAILANPSLAAKLATRVYPVFLPQNTDRDAQGRLLPALVLRRISGSALGRLEGPSGWNRVRLELTWWDSNVAQSEQYINQIRSLLSSFSGTLGGVSGVKCGVYGFNGPRAVFDSKTREVGTQLDIMMLVDEDTVS